MFRSLQPIDCCRNGQCPIVKCYLVYHICCATAIVVLHQHRVKLVKVNDNVLLPYKLQYPVNFVAIRFVYT